MSSRKILNSHYIYRCGDNPTKAERNSSDEGALNVKYERNIESFNQETQERIIAEAQIRLPSCTYCRYNVDHSFKTLKDRETHEELCPDRAAYERKNSQTNEIYNRHKQYIEQVRDKKREKNAKFQISNAPSAANFPNLKYKYVMNEPFVAGSQATNQWSHEQLTFKR